jgi:hypothetical protein
MAAYWPGRRPGARRAAALAVALVPVLAVLGGGDDRGDRRQAGPALPGRELLARVSAAVADPPGGFETSDEIAYVDLAAPCSQLRLPPDADLHAPGNILLGAVAAEVLPYLNPPNGSPLTTAIDGSAISAAGVVPPVDQSGGRGGDADVAALRTREIGPKTGSLARSQPKWAETGRNRGPQTGPPAPRKSLQTRQTQG